VDLFRLIKENSVTLAKAEKMSPEMLKDKILVGKLYQDETKPELSEKIYGMMTE
jgi:hypothetical protein